MSVKPTSSKKQVVVYLKAEDHDRLDQLRKQDPFEPSMSKYAGTVLKNHARKQGRKSA